MEKPIFTSAETTELKALARTLLREAAEVASPKDFATVKDAVARAYSGEKSPVDRHGINRVLHSMRTAIALCQMVSPDRNMIIATMTYGLCMEDAFSQDQIRKLWGEDVEHMVGGQIGRAHV